MIDCSSAESSLRGCKFTAKYSSDSGTLSPNIQVEAQQVNGLQDLIPDISDIVEYSDDAVSCDTFYDVEFAEVQRVNKVIQTDGSLSDSSSHYTWVYSIDRDVKVWFDTSSLAALGNKTYVAVSAIISGTTTSRMRFVNNSEDTLPNSENPLSLSEGDTLMIDCSSAESSSRGCKFTAKYKSDSGTLSSDIQVEAQQIRGLQQMYLKKTAGQFDIYIKNKAGYVHYPLVHATKPYQGETTDAAFYDCWGIKQVSQCDTNLNEVETLFAKSEAEVASSVPNYAGNNMATGGSVHGYENIIEEDGARKVVILIDGIQVAEDAVIPLSPVSCISITQQTELYPVGINTNPFAHVTKFWEFREGRMRLSATYTLLREIALNHVYIGMFGIYRRSEGQSNAPYLTSRCQKRNLPLTVYNIEDGWWNESYRLELQGADKNCSAITLWGDEDISAEFSIIEPSPEETRGMFIQHNGGLYNKTYYRVVGLDPQVQEGTEYKATIQWTFF